MHLLVIMDNTNKTTLVDIMLQVKVNMVSQWVEEIMELKEVDWRTWRLDRVEI